MAHVAVNGRDAQIWVSGTEIEGGNAWSIAIEHNAVQYAKFADEWQNTLSGLKSWSGSITSWHDQGSKVLQTAAALDGTVLVLLYPDHNDTTTFYGGNAVFSASSEASIDAVISVSADFTGDSTLTLSGFA